MKKFFLLVILFCISINVSALEKVPLEDFAQKSKFKDFKISPDGKHIAFTYDDKSEVRLAVMNLESNKIKMSFGPGGKEREFVQFFWATNERIIMLSEKITGWLDGQAKQPSLVAANIDGSKRREIWNFARAGVNLLSTLDNDPKHILVGKYHFTDGGGMKLNRMNIYTGDMKFVTGSPQAKGSSDSVIRGIYIDNNDEPRVALEYDPLDEDDFEDDESFFHIKANDEWKLLTLPKNRDKKPNINGAGFSADNTKFYFFSNHDLDHAGVLGLFELDLNTQAIKFLFRHPDVDLQGGLFGPDGELIGVYYEPGYPEYYYLDNEEVAEEVAFHKSLRASFKNENIGISSYTVDGKTATLRVNSDKNPGDFYLFDRDKKEVKFVGSAMPNIKPAQMAAVEPFTFIARDGLKMYGQMTIPNSGELKDLPLVIYPHGGPYGAKDRWGFYPRAQMLANNGYLVIQLNFRGSGGYGEDFYQAGKGEWGGKMQDDLTDVTKWAIQQGYADKNRVCIHGVSYGGYASMHAVVKEPNLYQCSIPDAGPYEIALQWKKADSFKLNKKAGRNFMKWSFGSNDEEALRKASPAYHVDNLKADLFIVHGSEDVRVPIANAYFLEEKLKEAGKPYETLYKKDGHGFQKIDYRVELYERMLAFLDKSIGEKE